MYPAKAYSIILILKLPHIFLSSRIAAVWCTGLVGKQHMCNDEHFICLKNCKYLFKCNSNANTKNYFHANYRFCLSNRTKLSLQCSLSKLQQPCRRTTHNVSLISWDYELAALPIGTFVDVIERTEQLKKVTRQWSFLKHINIEGKAKSSKFLSKWTWDLLADSHVKFYDTCYSAFGVS